MNWICQFCGGDTSDVEYEYLDGHNHLSCTLDYLKDNKVQFNIWKNGGVELNRLPVNVIRDRNELINRMIAEVKKS